MAKHFGIANTYSQRRRDLGASFGVASVYMESPGIGVKREDIVPAGVFRLGNRQRLCRHVGMVGVEKNQFSVGIVRTNTFEARLALKFCKSFLGLVSMAGEFQSFSQIVEILGMRGRFIALSQSVDRIFISLLLDANFGEVAQSIVISGENGQCLLQRVVRFSDLAR